MAMIIRTSLFAAMLLVSGTAFAQGIDSSLENLRMNLAARHLLDGQPVTFSSELERIVVLTEQSRALLGPGAKAPAIPRRRLSVEETFFYYVVQPIMERRQPAGDQLEVWRRWMAESKEESNDR